MPAPELRTLAAALGLTLATGLVIACGFDFPTMLTQDRQTALQQPVEGNFLYDTQHLLPPPAKLLSGAIEISEGDATDALEAERNKAEGLGLTHAQTQQIRRMRLAADGDGAYAAGLGLSPEVRLYTAAAVDFGLLHGKVPECEASLPAKQRNACLKAREQRQKQTAQRAAQRFSAVLALPAGQRQLRGVWAAYSLARLEHDSFADIPPARIDAHFELARRLALAGTPDPLGLGLDSLGAQAALRLERQDYAGAIKQYAEQASHGSVGATASLKMVAQNLLTNPQALAQSIRDPLVQRLLARYLLAYGADDLAADNALANFQASSGDAATKAGARRLQRFIAALGQAGIETPADADRLAAAAYAQGNFDVATRFAAVSNTALARWVSAKLALRGGHPDEARGLFAEALAAQSEPAGKGNPLRLQAENGTLLLAHGDIQMAFAQFYMVAGKYWNDVAYLAERVLTTDELKAFVDAKVPRSAATQPSRLPAAEGYLPRPDAGAEWPAFSPAIQLRDLLARRLMREGRHDEALDYFHSASDPHFEPRIDIREQAHAYILALRRADHAWTATGRAESLYEAARIARWHGMEIMGYELGPDWYVYGGDTEDVVLPPTLRKLATAAEVERFDSTRPAIDKRFHYRHIAVRLALQATENLPPRSLTYGQVHANAFSWVVHRDPQAAQNIYQHYLKLGAAGAFRTTPPDFWNARLFWLRHATDHLAPHALHLRARRHKTAVLFIGLGGSLALLLGVHAIFKRRRKAAPQ